MNRNRTARTMAVALAASVAGLLMGCANQNARSTDRELPLEQRHSYEVVQLRAQDLKPGMSRADVFLLLGSPAEYRGDTWIYRNGDRTMAVTFRDGLYAGHESD